MFYSKDGVTFMLAPGAGICQGMFEIVSQEVVDMGISSNIIKSSSQKCYMIFWDMTIYSDIPNLSDIKPISDRITELGLITDFDRNTEFLEFF